MNRPARLMLALVTGTVMAADPEQETTDSPITAVARPVYSVSATPNIEKLEFDFGADEPAAWLNRDGDFGVRSWIKHSSLLCASYRLGMRFGVGAPGCLNVNWINEPGFVTSHVQCNGARILHLGGDSDASLGAAIGRITCAERIVRCTGFCR